MSTTQRKKPAYARSGLSRTKRKPRNSNSKTKALVNKAEHVRRETFKPEVRARGKSSATNEKPTANGTGHTPEMLPTAATDNTLPFASPTRALALWFPMGVLMRQQTLMASLALNVIQSQRLWAQAWSARRDSA